MAGRWLEGGRQKRVGSQSLDACLHDVRRVFQSQWGKDLHRRRTPGAGRSDGQAEKYHSHGNSAQAGPAQELLGGGKSGLAGPANLWARAEGGGGEITEQRGAAGVAGVQTGRKPERGREGRV